MIDRFLPASGPSQGDQLYHALFEDGDGEEYFETELLEVMQLYDQLHGDAHNAPYRASLKSLAEATTSSNRSHAHANPAQWTAQHCSVGTRVCKHFAGSLRCVYDPAALEAFLAAVTAEHPEFKQEQAEAPAAGTASQGTTVAEIPAVIGNALSGLVPESLLYCETLSEKSPALVIGIPTEQQAACQKKRNFDGVEVCVPNSGMTIKKKKGMIVEADDFGDTKPTVTSCSSSGKSGLVAASTSDSKKHHHLTEGHRGGIGEDRFGHSKGQRERPAVAHQAPARAGRCVNPENVHITRFFGECLSVMGRHQALIERARRRTSETRGLVTLQAAHKLVEDMAGDLIQTISDSFHAAVGSAADEDERSGAT